MTTAMRLGSVMVLVGALCCAAWAGNVSVKVENAGAAVDGAIVNIEPGGPGGTTNPAGKWNASGVAAGNYRVVAWKTIAGTLRGAIANVVVPATGNVDVSLALTDAVWTYNCFPYAVGNTWQYQKKRTDAAGTTTGTRRDRVDRTVTIDGETAAVIKSTDDGDSWEETRGSTRSGFALYNQQNGPDTIKFDPPMRLGPLMPLGYEWIVSSTAKHSDGSPDTPVMLRCKLGGFDTVVAPAGTFPHCARLEVTMVMGDANQLRLWAANDVGMVKQIERNAERTNTELLEEYHVGGLLPRPILRPIGPIMRLP